MTKKIPSPFPFTICWDGSRRGTVLNPIALDVPEAIFQATHNPSFVQQEGVAAGTILEIGEAEFLKEFLSESLNHVFTAVVGDTGTGKSHFVRWLYLEINKQTPNDPIRRHVLVIPRSSANLADVMRRILQDFQGEATDRLRMEIERHRGLSESEARQRVLDEFAIVIENISPEKDEDAETEIVRTMLPALLRDNAIRRVLIQKENGIIQRLSKHILGRRDSAEPENLRWEPIDLEFPAVDIQKAGMDASELASGLINDDRLRASAIHILQRAQTPSVAALLRFRSGDLKRALNEIRAQLARQNIELILLLEDLSITEGLDGELLEALQVRTQDTGTQLCPLRSIVGLTREDYQRLRENIKGRLTHTLWFDAPIGQGTKETEENALAGFAARYMNAVRLEANDLDKWASNSAEIPLLSACEDCPNRSDCHAAFGEKYGYGLYPFTPITIRRLYRRVVSSDGPSQAFKPRQLIKILNTMLDGAERSLEKENYPAEEIIKSFGLGETTSQLQLALRNQFGNQGDRILRLIELYADQPAVDHPSVPDGIASSFNIQLPTAFTGPVPSPDPKPVQKPIKPSAPVLNVFDQWLRGETPSDSHVNIWRPKIHEAVQAAIDWDVEGLGHLKKYFVNRMIKIEGQKTKILHPILTISRTPESTVTLRLLTDGIIQQDIDIESSLRTARFQIDTWAEIVRKAIKRLYLPSEGINPAECGIQVLILGVFITGKGSRSSSIGQLLDLCLSTQWDTELDIERSPAWSAIARAFKKHGNKVQEQVRHILSCTKGGQAGSFLDPSIVIKTLYDIRRANLPIVTYNEAIEWGAIQNIGTLAKDIHQHLSTAISDERNSIETWNSLVKQKIGEDSPVDLLGWISEAIEAASGVGSGDNKLQQEIIELRRRPVKSCFDLVDRVLTSHDDIEQLIALGRLDKRLMKQIANLFDRSYDYLIKANQHLEQSLKEAHDGITIEKCQKEVLIQLNHIEDAYKKLLGEESIDG